MSSNQGTISRCKCSGKSGKRALELHQGHGQPLLAEDHATVLEGWQDLRGLGEKAEGDKVTSFFLPTVPRRQNIVLRFDRRDSVEIFKQ